MGFLLIIESLFLMLSAAVSFYYHEINSGDHFLITASITMILGILMRLLGDESKEKLVGNREGFLVVTLAWIIMSAFGMLPLYMSGCVDTWGDAYFEIMSGFTTTGSTVLTNINSLPHGILFWRSVTQWIGGVGIVVFALAFLPSIGGHATFLYDAETTGISKDKFQPRVTQVAKRLWGVYIFLTVVLVVLLWLGPMSFFDAVCHAMTTASTGGFSTRQESIAYWNSPYIDYVISFFMFVCGINFALIYYSLKGDPWRLLKNEEFRWYIFLFILFVLLITASLYFQNVIDGFEPAFRTAFFQVASAITTSGFFTTNYLDWGAFSILIMCVTMFFCACAGSTSGGVKIIRLVVLIKNAMNEFKRQAHPNIILSVRINDQVLPVETVTKILAFVFLYLGVLFISSLILAFAGIEFEESVTSSLSCMSNVGLGGIDPSGTYAEAPEFVKWFLSFLMLVGRLELFTVLSLLMPSFWRQ